MTYSRRFTSHVTHEPGKYLYKARYGVVPSKQPLHAEVHYPYLTMSSQQLVWLITGTSFVLLSALVHHVY